MITNRYGEDGYPPFRTERLFSENGQWYFDTREGTQIGPYVDLNEIKIVLAVFIAQRILIAENSWVEEPVSIPGSQDGVEHLVEELYEFFRQYMVQGQTAAMLWGNQRLRELMRSRDDLPGVPERMKAIRYALNMDYDSSFNLGP